MSKRFTTIFPICENVHLTKDLGQIPYFLHKKHGYDSKIVCYKNSKDYSNIETEVKGLKIEFINNSGRISFAEKSVLKYIYRNARKTDVLNLYIFSKHSFLYGVLYKLLNPKGFLFLKLDGYNETFAVGTKVIHSQKRIKNFFLKRLENIFLKKVDLVSIENKEGERLVKLMYPQIAEKVAYFPVGVNDVFLEHNFKTSTRPFTEKENIILTAGRIGEPIKNHEMLISALLKMDIKDWKMVFVGPVNPGFKKYFDRLCHQIPELRFKVIFTGELTDRKELYEWYNRSKIFCMTSLKESFCHSIAEALYFGNYIVGTEGIMSMKDISDNEKYGTILKTNDGDGLANVLQKMIDDQAFLKELHPRIVSFSRKNFVWSGIVQNIKFKIELS